MIYVLIIIGIILLVIGSYVGKDRFGDDNCYSIFGCVLTVISSAILFVCLAIYTYDKYTIDSRISVLEEQNAIILEQIEPVIKQALDYESNTYKELRISPEKLIALGNMYPNLKHDTFIQTQLQVIINNQLLIRDLKLDKATLNAYHFWLWTKLE